jgi:hypothetical protein
MRTVILEYWLRGLARRKLLRVQHSGMAALAREQGKDS